MQTRKTKNILFWLGLSLPMLALVAMTWLVHQTGHQFDQSFNWVMHTYKVMDKFEQVQGHIVDAEANQRSFLLTGRKEFLEPYQRAMQATRDDLGTLKQLTSGMMEQQSSIAALEKLVNETLVFDPDTAFPPGRSPADASVVAVTEQGKQKLEQMRRLLFQAHQDQLDRLNRHEQHASSQVVTNQIMSLVLILAVAVALTLVVVILLRLERLQEFVTVCAWTGQVRLGDKWVRLDEYLSRRFGMSVSHSMSQEVSESMMRELSALNTKEPNRTVSGS